MNMLSMVVVESRHPKGGWDSGQTLNDQKRIIREEFIEELDAFAASAPVVKDTAKSMLKRRKLINLRS